MTRTIFTIGLAAGLGIAVAGGALAADPAGTGTQYQQTNEYREQHQGSAGTNQYREQYQERQRHEEAVKKQDRKQQTKGTKTRTKSRSTTRTKVQSGS